MPSPLGHALGGIAAAWAIDLLPRHGREAAPPGTRIYDRAGGALTLICAGLAAFPDADLLVGGHRTVTHSITAALLVAILATAVTRWVTPVAQFRSTRSIGTASIWRVGVTCGAAYATHLLLDWLQIDRNPPSGIQVLWPFSREWFISGVDLFPRTERTGVLSAAGLRTNLNALIWETAILLPIVLALWSVRVKAVARFTAKLSRGDHAA